MDTVDCGWCDGANKCENIFELDACSNNDRKNPRGFQLAKKCDLADASEQDVLSEDKTSVLVSAIVGTLLAASLALAAMAYLMRGHAMAPMIADGLELADGVGFSDSGIYEATGFEKISGIYQA